MSRSALHYGTKYSRGLSPVAAVTDNTAFVSEILDTANWDQNEFIMMVGEVADADATFTILFEDGDNSALSDNAAVADAQLLGTESGAAFLFSDDNKTVKIGYIGKKRYIRVTITPAANSGDIYLAAVWAQAVGRTQPQSTQIN
jgi:hypothetical protein